MFLHKLNAEQRKAFLVMAQRISMADGEDDMGELGPVEIQDSQTVLFMIGSSTFHVELRSFPSGAAIK